MSQTFQIITPNILVVPIDFVTVVIAKGDKLAVMDSAFTPAMPDAILPALAHFGCTLADVDYVINTHGHWDHVQGNPAIVEASGAEVWIPAGESEKLTAMADRFLVDGDIIDLGQGITFEVISAPGHALEICCLYHEAEDLLFASDATQGYSFGIPLIFHSPAQYLQSIKRLQGLDIETLILGHQFAWSGEPGFIHYGSETIKQYLVDCQYAAAKTRASIAEAAANCPDYDYICIVEAAFKQLRDDPEYLGSPEAAGMTWGHGTIISTLRELGITPKNAIRSFPELAE